MSFLVVVEYLKYIMQKGYVIWKNKEPVFEHLHVMVEKAIDHLLRYY